MADSDVIYGEFKRGLKLLFQFLPPSPLLV